MKEFTTRLCEEHDRFYEGKSCPDCRQRRWVDGLVMLVAVVSAFCIAYELVTLGMKGLRAP